jgi:hypothetical protein
MQVVPFNYNSFIVLTQQLPVKPSLHLLNVDRIESKQNEQNHRDENKIAQVVTSHHPDKAKNISNTTKCR